MGKCVHIYGLLIRINAQRNYHPAAFKNAVFVMLTIKKNKKTENNEKYKIFNNWFVNRYGNRCKYKSIIEMMQEEVSISKDNLNKVELKGINFVVGKEQEEPPKEEPQQNLDLDSTLILDAIDLPEDEPPVRKEAHQAGYVSYYLLGVFSIAISLVILYLLL